MNCSDARSISGECRGTGGFDGLLEMLGPCMFRRFHGTRHVRADEEESKMMAKHNDDHDGQRGMGKTECAEGMGDAN